MLLDIRLICEWSLVSFSVHTMFHYTPLHQHVLAYPMPIAFVERPTFSSCLLYFHAQSLSCLLPSPSLSFQIWSSVLFFMNHAVS